MGSNFLEHLSKLSIMDKDANPIRTLSEILIEADGAEKLCHLTRLSDELTGPNKKYHSIAELSYGLEHIMQLGTVINQKNLTDKLFNK